MSADLGHRDSSTTSSASMTWQMTMEVQIRKSQSARRPAPRRRPLAVLCGLVVLLACAALPASAGAAEAGVGLNTLSAPQIAQVKAVGAHWVRIFVSWRGLQPTNAPVQPTALASYESLFSQLPKGTKVIMDVFGTPQWETGSSDEHAPPANPHDYADFIGTLARQFGSRVAAYEIWNEEDSSSWWTGGPNPAAYTELLKATYPAVKAAEPKATVVLGGLTGNDYQFLEGVYQAGGKGYFDAVGVHTDTACNVLSPYDFLKGPENRLIPDSFLAYREVHAVMVANGDEKPIWMTELSWRTTEATCDEGAWAGVKPEGVSEEQQATYLTQAYHCLAQAPYVQVALWFPIQDEGVVVSGLVRADGSHKPSFAAMRNYVRNGDTLNEPCGNFTGPKLDVSSPANHSSYQGPLPIHVTATSGAGVFRIRLEIDGKLIRNYGAAGDPDSLTGELDWMGAKNISPGWHTLTVLGYDKQRNISQVNLSIFHGSAAGASGAGHHVSRKHKHKAKRRHKHRNAARAAAHRR
jgi:Cellulase (glycosyl hydrolase family 5)